ncbi:hypothetical protein [Lysinibacillus sp. 54212]|uniref:hypothetical protein n=1 Tax=Lysinibacillus sp. 54212 TaxID=3119829 RepID=UPI002FC7148E
MRDNLRPSLVFIVLAIAVLIVAPLVILIVPLMAVETLYFDHNNIVLITPKRNFILLTAAFLGVILALFLLSWKRNKATYALAILLVIASGVAAYLSPKSYIAIQEEGLKIKGYNHLTTYKWSDMIGILYEFSETEPANYTFSLKNGEKVHLVENGQIGSGERGIILSLARQHNIDYTEKESASE